MPDAAHDEVEAKLLAPDAETLRRIAALEAIGRFRVEPADRSHLETCYLDTADRRLLAERVALRVRSIATGHPPAGPAAAWEMTAKWAGSVDARHVHARRELTVPLAGPGVPAGLPAGPLRDALGDIAGDRPLEILFITDIDRATALIYDRDGATVAELALDTVQHSTPSSPKPCAPYHEVEIERVGAGSAAVVAEIAASLRAAFPLQPTSDSKYSRALRDLRGLALPEETTTGDRE